MHEEIGEDRERGVVAFGLEEEVVMVVRHTNVLSEKVYTRAFDEHSIYYLNISADKDDFTSLQKLGREHLEGVVGL